MKPEDLQLPAGAGPVRVRWLGTAGFELEHDGHVVLIDPYVTRAPLGACLTRPLVSDEALLAKHLPRADAIVLGHTHFDHALDVPALARRTGARVFGSASCATLCRARGVPAAQLHEPREAEVGPFRLRFVPSAHSPLLLGRVPFEGEIADCDDVPLRAQQYRCGAVFGVEIEVAGRRIFHLGSAQILDLAPRETDLLLCCTAGWQSTRQFPERAARALSPRTILLSHWDNFLKPLEAGAHLLPAMQLPRLVDRFRRATRDAHIGTVPLLGGLRL